MKSAIAFLVLATLMVGCSQPAETPASPTANTESPAPVATIGADKVVRNAEGKAYCVVMNTPVALAEADAPKAEHEGVTYYFCCESCPGMFKKDPAKYAVAKN